MQRGEEEEVEEREEEEDNNVDNEEEEEEEGEVDDDEEEARGCDSLLTEISAPLLFRRINDVRSHSFEKWDSSFLLKRGGRLEGAKKKKKIPANLSDNGCLCFSLHKKLPHKSSSHYLRSHMDARLSGDFFSQSNSSLPPLVLTISSRGGSPTVLHPHLWETPPGFFFPLGLFTRLLIVLFFCFQVVLMP